MNHRVAITVLFSLSLFSTSLLAYDVGDSLSPEVKQALKLKPNHIGIVDFFASWCKSCEKEIPDLQQFANDTKGGHLQLIGVDVDEALEDGLAFQKKLNIQFPVVNDTQQTIIQAFAPIGMPAMYYIVDGKVVGKHIGPINNIAKSIRSDLKKAGVTLP